MKKKPTIVTRSRAHIEYLKVQNFRALREVEFKASGALRLEDTESSIARSA